MEISTNLLLLTILSFITVIGYMIAINAQGATKISISFLMATLLLAGDIFFIVEYVNEQKTKNVELEYQKRLQKEKENLEKKVVQNSVSKEELQEKAAQNDEILKVQSILNKAKILSNKLSSLDLRNYQLDVDQRIAIAAKLKRDVVKLDSEYKALSNNLVYIKEPAINNAFAALSKSALYAKLYYQSEDGEQEDVRERVMRSKAKEAYNLFNSVNKKLEGMK